MTSTDLTRSELQIGYGGSQSYIDSTIKGIIVPHGTNINFFGGLIKGCIDSGFVMDKGRVTFHGTKFIDNFYGTKGNIETTHSAGATAYKDCDISLIGCTLSVSNSVDGFSNAPFNLGTDGGNTIHLTDCTLIGDGICGLTAGSQKGTINMQNCKYQNFAWGVNYSGSGNTTTYHIGGEVQSGIINGLNMDIDGDNTEVIHDIIGVADYPILETCGSHTFDGVAEVSYVVTHGLTTEVLPTSIVVSFGDEGVSPSGHTCWVSNASATQFTINIDSAIYVAVKWIAKV